MRRKLEDYRDIAGDKVIDKIYESASTLSEKHVIHISSTFYGGGVVEILNNLVPLMNDAGIKTEWRLLKGNSDFFNITKSFHNSLQGSDMNLTEEKKNTYLEVNEYNAVLNYMDPSDCVVVHDPQPLALINFYNKRQPWIWRCHPDLSNPNKTVWNYLKQFIMKYDFMIVSNDKFKQDINIPQKIIYPSIDPLSLKNKELDEETCIKVLERHNIPLDKPIISQVSRFDKFKDPLGVIEVYKLIKKQSDCRLVFVANSATDDPEGLEMYKEVLKKAEGDKDIIIVMNSEDNDRLVNSLQRKSSVVIQKSTKEGFGLTVSEALWKETPVVGGNAGGIPNQIIHGRNGYIVNNVQECADSVLALLKNQDKAVEFGKFGKKHVKENFLIIRHLQDYIDLLNSLLVKKEHKVEVTA